MGPSSGAKVVLRVQSFQCSGIQTMHTIQSTARNSKLSNDASLSVHHCFRCECAQLPRRLGRRVVAMSSLRLLHFPSIIRKALPQLFFSSGNPFLSPSHLFISLSPIQFAFVNPTQLPSTAEFEPRAHHRHYGRRRFLLLLDSDHIYSPLCVYCPSYLQYRFPQIPSNSPLTIPPVSTPVDKVRFVSISSPSPVVNFHLGTWCWCDQLIGVCHGPEVGYNFTTSLAEQLRYKDISGHFSADTRVHGMLPALLGE